MRLTQADLRRFAWASLFSVCVATAAIVFTTPVEAQVVIPISDDMKKFLEWCRTHASSLEYLAAGCWLYL